MRNKQYVKIILIVIVILIGTYFGIKFIQNEFQKMDTDNDFTRGNVVLILGYNQNINLIYDVISNMQVTTKDERIMKKDLIYDYKEKEMIPILQFLKEKNEDDVLVEAFQNLTSFYEDINSMLLNDREDIIVKQSNNKYYTIQNNVYYYEINKPYITKEEMNDLYNRYINTNINDYFINILYKNSKIKELYNYEKLSYLVNNEYDQFYQENEEEIINVISNDLNKFTDYLKETFLKESTDENGNTLLTYKKLPDVEYLKLSFKFKKLEKTYGHNYIYQLDLNDLIKQINAKKLPLLYI